ncbi:hypothetical protein BC826DRAFT_974775 [Russula brevipes]|nr:hypothetical protein BC826DRAFT_974775 [Russula brevipes]
MSQGGPSGADRLCPWAQVAATWPRHAERGHQGRDGRIAVRGGCPGDSAARGGRPRGEHHAPRTASPSPWNGEAKGAAVFCLAHEVVQSLRHAQRSTFEASELGRTFPSWWTRCVVSPALDMVALWGDNPSRMKVGSSGGHKGPCIWGYTMGDGRKQLSQWGQFRGLEGPLTLTHPAGGPLTSPLDTQQQKKRLEELGKSHG